LTFEQPSRFGGAALRVTVLRFSFIADHVLGRLSKPGNAVAQANLEARAMLEASAGDATSWGRSGTRRAG
jgi:hypothetical protein